MPQGLTIGQRVLRDQVLDRSITVLEQVVTPALGAMIDLYARPVGLLAGLQCRANRFGIDPAHQFADQLALTAQAAVAANLTGELHGTAQIVGQGQACQHGPGQVDEALAEVLQRFRFALGGTLAGPAVAVLAHGIAGKAADHSTECPAHLLVSGSARRMGVFLTGTRMTTPQTAEELQALALVAIEHARALGAEQAEAGISLERGLSVTVRLGEIETLERQQDRGMGITVYMGGRKGSASTADLSVAALREAVAKACSIASCTAADEYSGLADAALMARDIPDLDLHHPWDISAEEATVLARRCEAAALASDARLTNSEGASVHTGAGVRVYANSHGFCAATPSSYHSLSCVVLGSHAEGMERDYWYTADRDWRRLEDAELVGLEAARRTLRRLGAGRVTTGALPVVFAPEVARGLFGHFIAAIRGTSQYRRSSFLLDALDEQVFPQWLQIDEQPLLQGAIGSAAYDNEGVATRERALILQGRLQGYVLSSYSARKLGMTTTGNAGGIHNLLVHPSAGGQSELLARMGTGLLITDLMGQGVNTVTGDYSRGAAGFRVENGEVTTPVSEITIAGNLRDMFKGIIATGSDVDTRGVIRCGSVLLERMMVAGS